MEDPVDLVMSDTLQVTKIDAAKRQLHTALTLWFADGDPISIHTLAFAAYELIHVISKKRNPKRRGLIFDSPVIKPEGQKPWNVLIKDAAAFFKHANNDPDRVLNFRPQTSELFMLFSIYGLAFCDNEMTKIQNAFILYIAWRSPKLLTDEAREVYQHRIKIEELPSIVASMTKGQFLEYFLQYGLPPQRPPGARLRLDC
jgi:hypothetical protein